MPSRRTRRSPRRTYLAVILVITIVVLVLPGSWTGRMISVVQVLVPLQDATASAVDSVGGMLGGGDETVSRQAYERVQRENEALRHQAAALATRVVELEKEVDLLTATRLWNVEGRIGEQGKLIPARVVTEDLLAWRSSRLVNVGALQGVRAGAPVTSRYFTIDRGDKGGVRSGLAVLLGEVFVGVVDQIGTHTARVKLLSDVTVEMKVRIGRFTDAGFEPLDQYFWLVGRGGGVMEIRDAQRRDVEAGRIQVGDIVLSDPATGFLPAAMTVGVIKSIRPDRDNPLLSILTVESAVKVDDLQRVFVFEPAPHPSGDD